MNRKLTLHSAMLLKNGEDWVLLVLTTSFWVKERKKVKTWKKRKQGAIAMKSPLFLEGGGKKRKQADRRWPMRPTGAQLKRLADPEE